MRFQPYPTRSGFLSLGATVFCGVVAGYLLLLLLHKNTPPQIFQTLLGLLVMLILTGLAAHWTFVAFKLRYHLNRNGVAIQWGLGQQRIPFNNILQIVQGNSVSNLPTFRGINIGGLRFGRGELDNYGTLKYHTTASLSDSLLIITPGQTYVISPQQPEQFLKAWQARQNLGPTQEWVEGFRRWRPFDPPLLTDRLAWWLLGMAALLLVSLLGFISLFYPELPGALPIHFDNLGRADRIAPKIFLFTLPVAGGIVWGINLILGSLIYRRERVGAYLLWGSTILVQLGLWIALLTITAA